MFEERRKVVQGIDEDFAGYPQQRVCHCGRKIARISHSELCQRCIDLDWAARFKSTRFRGKEPTLAEMVREREA